MTLNLSTLLLIAFPLLAILFLILFILQYIRYRKIYTKYKDVVDIDVEVEKSKKSLEKAEKDFKATQESIAKDTQDLKSEYQSKKSLYEELLKEISIYQDDLEFTSFGMYHPHFDFDTSEKYKDKITDVRDQQKTMIKNKSALICAQDWQVEGSKSKGRAMINQNIKLMLRAFNNECDAAILKVRWNNIDRMEQRIYKAFDAINKLGSHLHISIQNNFLNLKLNELHLAYEYQEKKQEEKEEQARIREQMREEEKVLKEIEKAKKDAEKEEKQYEKALKEARAELEKAGDAEKEALNKHIELLMEKLQGAHDWKERAISRAQLTKSGHVYVISNIGSFGENVYKIGMTRRLEPSDRVRELGGASVPFHFDVHAMIYSENAPELETALHNEFSHKRVNRVNTRKEYFNVDLKDIEDVVTRNYGSIEFTKIAEAKEYRETISLIETEENKSTMSDYVDEKFPDFV